MYKYTTCFRPIAWLVGRLFYFIVSCSTCYLVKIDQVSYMFSVIALFIVRYTFYSRTGGLRGESRYVGNRAHFLAFFFVEKKRDNSTAT